MADLKLVVLREPTIPVDGGESFTPGKMFANGLFICNTCEDADRFLENGGKKVQDKTAIPRGIYEVGITFSNRFQKPLPQLFEVEGYSGVRIHGGNRAENSQGCILVGQVRTNTGIAKCAESLQRIINMIEDCEDSGGKVTLEIK